DTPNLNAALPTGTLAQALQLKAPRRDLWVNGELDYAPTPTQTLRFAYAHSGRSSDNLGVGGYDEPERAYATDSRMDAVRVQQAGPIGRRAFLRSRVQLVWFDTGTRSATEAPTIRVL